MDISGVDCPFFLILLRGVGFHRYWLLAFGYCSLPINFNHAAGILTARSALTSDSVAINLYPITHNY